MELKGLNLAGTEVVVQLERDCLLVRIKDPSGERCLLHTRYACFLLS